MAKARKPKKTAKVKSRPKPAAVKKPFRFRDLPTEVQLKIFQVFKPAMMPKSVVEDEIDQFVKPDNLNSDEEHAFLQQKVSEENVRLEELAVHRQSALSLLLLNQSTFKDFAPHYYQYNQITFADPVKFSTEFLAQATDACLYNLRFLCCQIEAAEGWFQRSGDSNIALLNKLPDFITSWPELEYLRRFELCYRTYPDYRHVLGLDHDDIASTDETGLWNAFDQAIDKRLSRFEGKALRKTLSGFEVKRGVFTNGNEDEPGGYWIVAVHITFTKV